MTALEPEPPEYAPEPPEESELFAPAGELEPESPPPASSPAPIGITDRCAAIGMTGKGKSVWCAALWTLHAGQRLLVDVNDAYEPGPDLLAEESGGYCRAERHRDIDWRCRTVHYVPRHQSMERYNDLYAAIFERRIVELERAGALGEVLARARVGAEINVLQGLERGKHDD